MSLTNAIDFIESNRINWTDDQVTKALEGIYWQRIQMARICLNATRTVARRLEVLRRVHFLARWRERECDGLRGRVWFPTSRSQQKTGLGLIQRSIRLCGILWVMHTMDSMNATNVENAPSSADLIGNWKDSIPRNYGIRKRRRA